MWISKKKFESLQNYVEVLQKDVMRTHIWHECQNCGLIFKRDSLILKRQAFKYCEPCQPKVKEEEELETWTATHKEEKLALKSATEDKLEN